MLRRKISVTYFFGRGRERPMIRLRGLWLAAAGFAKGAQVAVTVSSGRLTLEVIPAARNATAVSEEAASYVVPDAEGET